ncbi:unnamed protein product [Ectocarpus sp. CCAP 1310/34]|nr:unnamed protein product [Ectocarpus sp. CCAP 1310/34]
MQPSRCCRRRVTGSTVTTTGRISLLSHVGKVHIKIITNRPSAFCEANNILPEEQCGFRPGRSTVDMLFVVRRLQELGWRKKLPRYMCFVDLNKANDSVDREMLWKVLARAAIPAKLIEVIRHFHDGMRARVRMDEGELSDWFFVTQGVRQGCVLSPQLFNILFAEVLEVVVIRFSEDDVRDVVCRRCWRRIEVCRRTDENDDHHR